MELRRRKTTNRRRGMLSSARAVAVSLLALGSVSSGHAAMPSFRISAQGSAEKQLVSDDHRIEHIIQVECVATVLLAPLGYECDLGRFVSESADLDANIRLRVAARQTRPQTVAHNYQDTSILDRPESACRVSFTPDPSDYLYAITKDVIYVPEYEVMVYALEYVSQLNVLRLWIHLPPPFSYSAELEHFDFPANHTLVAKEATPGCVHGVVTLADTGRPAAGARVTAGNRSATTSDSGEYLMQGIEPGSHSLRVDYAGYPFPTQEISISPLTIVRQDIELQCCIPVGPERVPTKPLSFGSIQKDGHKLAELETIETEKGEALRVWWVRGHYELRYHAEGVDRERASGRLLGMCLFEGGMNWAVYESIDLHRPLLFNQPDCLRLVRWMNYDFGIEDDTYGSSGKGDGLIDVHKYEYDVCSDTLRLYIYKFEYKSGRPGEEIRIHGNMNTRDYLGRQVCPGFGPFVLGAHTDYFAFRDEVCAIAASLETPAGLGSIRYGPCGAEDARTSPGAGGIAGDQRDIDSSGVFDQEDLRASVATVGATTGQAGFNELLDADADGTVSIADLGALFPGDTDQDGMSDWQEAIADTDPQDPGSVFRVSASPGANGRGLSLVWTGVRGRRYSVFRSSAEAPGDWRAVATDIRGEGASAEFTDASVADGAGRLYRIHVSLE